MTDDVLDLQYFVVSIVDVLGQGKLLENLDDIDLGNLPEEARKAEARKAFGPILRFRDDLERYFKGLDDGSSGPPGLKDLIADGGQVHRIAFSDSMMFAVGLGKGLAPENKIIGVHRSFMALASSLLMGLSRRAVVRGAVDVGYGIRLEFGEVLGGALARVHWMESECAEYPRVVVGQRLMLFVEKVRRIEGHDARADCLRSLAEQCVRMVARDSDGCIILDYLGPYFHEHLADTVPLAEIQLFRDWVRAEAQRYEAIRDVSLAKKYHRLASYFQSRAELWSMDGIGS